MPTEIVVVVDDMRLNGYLGDTPTGQALADALPIEAQAQLWGEEIYFPCPGWWRTWMILRRWCERRRSGLLAHRPGLLHLLRPDAGERPRGDSPGQRREPGGAGHG